MQCFLRLCFVSSAKEIIHVLFCFLLKAFIKVKKVFLSIKLGTTRNIMVVLCQQSSRNAIRVDGEL